MGALKRLAIGSDPIDPPVWDPPDTGVIWLDLALWVAVVVVLTFCFLVMIFHRLAFKPLKEMVKSIKEDAAVTREQTENSHAGAPNPNLRDDIDAKHNQTHEELANLAKMMSRMVQAQARTDKELSRINDTLVDDREATREVAKKLDVHIEQKSSVEPRLSVVEREIKIHRKKTEPPI